MLLICHVGGLLTHLLILLLVYIVSFTLLTHDVSRYLNDEAV